MIDEEIGLEIDNLHNEGKTYREIAKKLNLSIGYISEYRNSKVKIRPKPFRNVQESSQDKSYDIKSELKEYVDKQLENYSVTITKDDLEDFRKDIIYQVREELKQIYKEIARIDSRIDQIDQIEKI